MNSKRFKMFYYTDIDYYHASHPAFRILTFESWNKAKLSHEILTTNNDYQTVKRIHVTCVIIFKKKNRDHSSNAIFQCYNVKISKYEG